MERLTLENAINRSRKLAERHRWNSENTKLETSDENANEVYKNTCIQYANQEEQYAEWLEELKSYKDIGTPKELKELKENGVMMEVFGVKKKMIDGFAMCCDFADLETVEIDEDEWED